MKAKAQAKSVLNPQKKKFLFIAHEINFFYLLGCQLAGGAAERPSGS